MSVFTPWLGICHLRQVDDGRPDAQPTLVAVWADSIERFERELHVHTNSHGLQMIWTEDVMSAEEWLTKHPSRKDGQRLAGKVSAKHLVALGGFGVGATGLGAYGLSDGEAEGYLHIEEIEGVEPLDAQFGVHPLKTVPDALYEPLFGQPEPSAAEVVQYGGADKVPPLNTYAILDAAKVVNFVVMLEASGLEYRCLFKGKAAEEMRDVAPYVVRLEEGNDFTRNLFSKDPEQDVPWFMWDKKPGIYVRSRGALADMWKHFRKFTKVQDENGKWFYVRFFDPVAALKILDQKCFWESCLRKPVVECGIIITKNKIVLLDGKHHTGDKIEIDFEKERTKEFEKTIASIAFKITESLPLRKRASGEINDVVKASVERMMTYGFRNIEHLQVLAAWEVLYGPRYEDYDPDHKLSKICQSKSPALRKFKSLKKRMSQLRFEPRNLEDAR